MNCSMCNDELDYAWNIDFEGHTYHQKCFNKIKIEGPYFKKHVPTFVDADIGVFRFDNQNELLKRVSNVDNYYFIKDGVNLMAISSDKKDWWVLGRVFNFNLKLPSFGDDLEGMMNKC